MSDIISINVKNPCHATGKFLFIRACNYYCWINSLGSIVIRSRLFIRTAAVNNMT